MFTLMAPGFKMYCQRRIKKTHGGGKGRDRRVFLVRTSIKGKQIRPNCPLPSLKALSSFAPWNQLRGSSPSPPPASPANWSSRSGGFLHTHLPQLCLSKTLRSFSQASFLFNFRFLLKGKLGVGNNPSLTFPILSLSGHGQLLESCSRQMTVWTEQPTVASKPRKGRQPLARRHSQWFVCFAEP